jgi:hypothetical protein
MIATREAPQIGYRNQYARTDAASNQLFVGDEIVECFLPSQSCTKPTPPGLAPGCTELRRAA